MPNLFEEQPEVAQETLNYIEVEGFRGFREKQIVNLGRPDQDYGSGLTYIVGPNNSGKSSILECFSFYGARDNNLHFSEGMRNKVTDEVKIAFHYKSSVDNFTSKSSGGSAVRVTMDEGRKRPYIVFPNRSFPARSQNISLFGGRDGYTKSARDHAHSRGVMPSNFFSRLSSIHDDDQTRDKMAEILSDLTGQDIATHTDRLDDGNTVIKIRMAGSSYTLEGVGDGIRSLVVIASAFVDVEDGSLIVLDEPEVSLHPAYQKRLSRFLAEKASKLQIVVATHSPYIVDDNAVCNGAAVVRVMLKDNKSVVATLQDDGRNSWKKLVNGNLNNPHQIGTNAKETLFLEDRIIVTEGQEDVLLLPRLFEFFEKEIPGNIFGWGAGGAANIHHILNILGQLGFEQIVAVYDQDQSAIAEVARAKHPSAKIVLLPFDDIRDKAARKASGEKAGLFDTKLNIPRDRQAKAKKFVEEVVAPF